MRNTKLRKLIAWVTRAMQWLEKEQIFMRAAQSAFFLLLSVFPLTLFLASLLSRGAHPLANEELAYFIPGEARALLTGVTAAPRAGLFSSVLAAATSAWSASVGIWWLMKGVFFAFHNKPIQGAAAFKGRLVSLALTVSFVVAALLPAGLGLLAEWALRAGFIPLQTTAAGARLLLSLGLAYLFIWPLYRFTPGLAMPPKLAARCAFYAAACWNVLNMALEIYFARIGRYAALYGGVGAVMALAFWLYAVSIIILLGAELAGNWRGTLGETF